MSTPLFDRREPTASDSSFAQERAREKGRRCWSLIRLVLTDRRVAVVILSWYVALLLGWQPDIPGAISMIVFAPLWLVLGLIGFLCLPGNLLINLQLEIPEPFHTYYSWAYILFVVGLHAWLYFAWRWAVLALVTLVLCLSSYGCEGRFPSLQ